MSGLPVQAQQRIRHSACISLTDDHRGTGRCGAPGSGSPEQAQQRALIRLASQATLTHGPDRQHEDRFPATALGAP